MWREPHTSFTERVRQGKIPLASNSIVVNTMISTKHATEAGAAAVMPASSTSFPIESALPALTTNMAASSLTNGGNSCLDEQIERLKRCEYLREGEVKALCLRAREILVDESNVQRVDAPVTVRQMPSCRVAGRVFVTFNLWRVSNRYVYIHCIRDCIYSGFALSWSECQNVATFSCPSSNVVFALCLCPFRSAVTSMGSSMTW